MRTVAAEWRIGKQPVEHAQDEIAVTIKVSAHLQYRDATISAGQRQKIRLGRNHRLGAGAPRYAFDGKRHLHLSRKRRDIILVQDSSDEHTSELQSLLRNSYAVFCLQKK